MSCWNVCESNLQETAPIPELERFVEGTHCMSMGMLWSLSASIPYSYTHSEKESEESPSGTKNPLLSSFQFLMKLVGDNTFS